MSVRAHRLLAERVLKASSSFPPRGWSSGCARSRTTRSCPRSRGRRSAAAPTSNCGSAGSWAAPSAGGALAARFIEDAGADGCRSRRSSRRGPGALRTPSPATSRSARDAGRGGPRRAPRGLLLGLHAHVGERPARGACAGLEEVRRAQQAALGEVSRRGLPPRSAAPGGLSRWRSVGSTRPRSWRRPRGPRAPRLSPPRRGAGGRQRHVEPGCTCQASSASASGTSSSSARRV